MCLYPEETLWMVDSGNLLLRDANGARIDRQWLWERCAVGGMLGALGSRLHPDSSLTLEPLAWLLSTTRRTVISAR